MKKPYSKKIGHGEYEICGSPKRRISFGVDASLALVNHKNRLRCVLSTISHRRFFSRHIISVIEAKRIIVWLYEYIQMVSPTEISEAVAATKAHTSGILRQTGVLAGAATLEEK